MTWKLSDVGVGRSLQRNELEIVEKLGGRISDLDVVSRIYLYPTVDSYSGSTIIHIYSQLVSKVRNGQSVTDAVDEIIYRGISEMRKNAFGDDLEDAKSLPWTREQAWSVLRALAVKDEVRCMLSAQAQAPEPYGQMGLMTDPIRRCSPRVPI